MWAPRHRCTQLAILLLFFACSTPEQPRRDGRTEQAPAKPGAKQKSDSASPEYSKFRERLDAGAGCRELFGLRNSVDPSSPDREKMNKELRAIHCYFSGSTRKDEAPATGGFTVKEYRIYRSVVDTPMSISENQAFQNAAQRFQVSTEQARDAVKKVQGELAGNSWYGSTRIGDPPRVGPERRKPII